MGSKTKTKPYSILNFRIFFVFLVCCALLYYIWSKICHVLFHQKTKDWWYIPIDMLWKKGSDGSLYTALSQKQFYTDLLYSFYEDLIGCLTLLLELFLQAGSYISYYVYMFITTSIIIIGITYVIFYTYRYKDIQQAQTDKRKRNNVKGNGYKDTKSGGDMPEGRVSMRKKMYRRWITGLVFFAFLVSIPWEFVRLYQSMVAEKVAQMKTGIPPDCIPDEMSFFQRIQSYLRMQLSWSEDPCLAYHKALLVDPMWQVNPLMVIMSAISQCIVYPLEILFGGLGKSLRLFFSEIPVQWQPFMLIVILIIVVLVLIMTFGYRIHLPFVLKLEPKSPRYVRYKSRVPSDKETPDNLEDSVNSTQDSLDQSSLDTQFSLDSQSYR